MEDYESSSTLVVTSTSRGALSNQINVSRLDTTQEEADTILILHVIEAAKREIEVHIMSPDTDVFILALAAAPHLGISPCILLGTGLKRRKVLLMPI